MPDEEEKGERRKGELEVALEEVYRKRASSARAAALAPGGRAPSPGFHLALAPSPLEGGVKIEWTGTPSGPHTLTTFWVRADGTSVRGHVVELGTPDAQGVLEPMRAARRNVKEALSFMERTAPREAAAALRSILEAMIKDGVPAAAIRAELEAVIVQSVMSE